MLSYPGRQVTSSCEIASLRFQGLLEANFKKINKSSGEQEKIHYSCESGIEKCVPRNHGFSSLGKPRDAKR